MFGITKLLTPEAPEAELAILHIDCVNSTMVIKESCISANVKLLAALSVLVAGFVVKNQSSPSILRVALFPKVSTMLFSTLPLEILPFLKGLGLASLVAIS
jgi:hypothetical protein